MMPRKKHLQFRSSLLVFLAIFIVASVPVTALETFSYIGQSEKTNLERRVGPFIEISPETYNKNIDEIVGGVLTYSGYLSETCVNSGQYQGAFLQVNAADIPLELDKCVDEACTPKQKKIAFVLDPSFTRNKEFIWKIFPSNITRTSCPLIENAKIQTLFKSVECTSSEQCLDLIRLSQGSCDLKINECTSFAGQTSIIDKVKAQKERFANPILLNLLLGLTILGGVYLIFRR